MNRIRTLGPLLATGLAVLLTTGCLGGTPKQSGVFTSRDSGVTWQAAPDLQAKGAKRPKAYPPLEVTAVAVSPLAPDTVVAGTDEELFKTTDAGRNWERLNRRLPTSKAVAVQVITWHPTEADTWYVGGVSAGYGKVLETTDGGGSFKDVFTVSRPGQAVTALLVDPANGQTVYAGDQLGSLYKSTDGATSWKRVFSVGSPISSLAVSGNSLFIATAGQGIFRTTDGGGTFAAINGSGLAGDALTVWSLSTGLGSLFAGTDQGLFVTKDFGATWQSIGNPLPPAGQRVQAVAVSNGHVYFATNAVVYQGDSSGNNFIPVQLKLAQDVFSLAVSQSDASVLYAGANAKRDFEERFTRGLPRLIKF